MGKGEIISNLGSGQYVVKILYDNKYLDKQIAQYNDKISTYQDKLSDPGYTDAQKAAIRVVILSAQKMIDWLNNNANADLTVNAWCADATLDLTGVVGTIEVPGERGVVQIKPGYDSALFKASDDGQLIYTATMFGVQAFYNTCVLPGWQKWQPTYRYGTITFLSGDTCSVDLDDTYSSQQSININKFNSLSHVDIVYMNCDGLAFSVGDEVLIEFIDQSWAKPQVIGFKTNPEPCNRRLIIIYGNPEEYLVINNDDRFKTFTDGEHVICGDGGTGVVDLAEETRLYGAFTKCFDGEIEGVTSGAKAVITGGAEQYYKRLYKYYNLVGGNIVHGSEDYQLAGPLDNGAISEVNPKSYPPNHKEWTKTCGRLSVSAFVPPISPFTDERWNLSAYFGEKPVFWPGSPSGVRYVCPRRTCLTSDLLTEVFIGFDLWREVNTTGGFDYFVSVIGDQEDTIKVYKYNELTNSLSIYFEKASEFRTTYYDPVGDGKIYARLVGLDEYTAYWCAHGRTNLYYKEDLQNNVITEYSAGDDVTIITTIWDHINKELHLVYSEAATIEETDRDEGSELSDIVFYQYGEPISQGYYGFGYYIYHAADHCDIYKYKPESFKNEIDIWHGKSPYGGTTRDIWYGAYTKVWSNSDEITDYKNYVIGDNVLDRGIQTVTTERNGTVITNEKNGYCSGTYNVTGNVYATVSVDYDAVKQYEITGLVVDAFGSISCTYNEITKDDDGEWGEWEEKQLGSYADSVSTKFPWDHTWKAILLEGEDRTESGTYVEYDKIMILKNTQTGELFLSGFDSGTTVCECDRAFFLQQ